jgi:RNA polymerase sigma-70 factor (ECF subfamily)
MGNSYQDLTYSFIFVANNEFMEDNSKENVCAEEIFNGLFRANSRDLYQFLYYKYGADNNPRDVVQDAFIKLWNNCQHVIPEKARPFLFTVANNLMLNELAKKKTVIKHSQEKQKGYTTESPEFIFEENEYGNKLQKAIEELTEEQRVTFLLSRIEGKKHQEIAEMLGISRKGVEKRIYTALAILKEKLGNI